MPITIVSYMSDAARTAFQLQEEGKLVEVEFAPEGKATLTVRDNEDEEEDQLQE